ncbi:hypothetical protein YK48G_04230 [Lentilactobacillus fungorum]|uniref:DUF1642 domain-containing protein n=1 Tax=Lentilactobacillus fungorum TaxID=2201250 RepID=A0ABQ3VX78_9LACO|nr:hypothetical protein [Lentilactobacillus fungorum]GHP12998.1 hypothetical protein YK48G_04230 [Lentilactobacillus fungorum]
MIEIKETQRHRKYFTHQMSGNAMFPPFLDGYIQIDKDMPHNYDDKFYDQFNFWCGPTFIGVIYPSVIRYGERLIMAPKPDFENLQKEYTLQDCFDFIKPSYLNEIKKLTDGQAYFWIVGFDDNHVERFGDENVVRDTKRIADEMDMVAK